MTRLSSLRLTRGLMCPDTYPVWPHWNTLDKSKSFVWSLGGAHRLQLLEGLLLAAARAARVPGVDLLRGLVARDHHLLRVDNDHVRAHVHARLVRRHRLAAAARPAKLTCPAELTGQGQACDSQEPLRLHVPAKLRVAEKVGLITQQGEPQEAGLSATGASAIAGHRSVIELRAVGRGKRKPRSDAPKVHCHHCC